MQGFETRDDSALTLYTSVVRAEWIDRNEHMNNSFYLVATQEAYLHALRSWRGNPPEAIRSEYGNFVTQSLVTYIREVREGARLTIKSRLAALDQKRSHIYAEMIDGETGVLAAVVERTSVNVLRGPPAKVVPYPADVYERLQNVRAVHATVPYPQGREPVLLLNARRQRREDARE